MPLRSRLRSLVRAHRSIARLSRATDIPESTLCRYIAGNNLPDYRNLLRFAEAGVDVNWLLTGRRSRRTK